MTTKQYVTVKELIALLDSLPRDMEAGYELDSLHKITFTGPSDQVTEKIMRYYESDTQQYPECNAVEISRSRKNVGSLLDALQKMNQSAVVCMNRALFVPKIALLMETNGHKFYETAVNPYMEYISFVESLRAKPEITTEDARSMFVQKKVKNFDTLRIVKLNGDWYTMDDISKWKNGAFLWERCKSVGDGFYECTMPDNYVILLRDGVQAFLLREFLREEGKEKK